MEARIIHDVGIVDEFLKTKNKYNYIYQLYNLEENQWKNVICYGLFDEEEIKEIAMVILSYDIPVLLAAGFDNERYSMKLVEEIKKNLPRKFYTHIDKITLEHVFSNNHISEMEEYMNMGFIDDVLDAGNRIHAKRLGFKEIGCIKELISASYPEAWLDDDLMKLNENFGIYVDEKLVSFGGIHAYSEQYQVAAVAHVTTKPSYRNRGYAEDVVRALTKSLREKIEYIGLNVKVNNVQAINCYKKLGYREFGRFIACEIQNNE